MRIDASMLSSHLGRRVPVVFILFALSLASSDPSLAQSLGRYEGGGGRLYWLGNPALRAPLTFEILADSSTIIIADSTGQQRPLRVDPQGRVARPPKRPIPRMATRRDTVHQWITKHMDDWLAAGNTPSVTAENLAQMLLHHPEWVSNPSAYDDEVAFTIRGESRPSYVRLGLRHPPIPTVAMCARIVKPMLEQLRRGGSVIVAYDGAMFFPSAEQVAGLEAWFATTPGHPRTLPSGLDPVVITLFRRPLPLSEVESISE